MRYNWLKFQQTSKDRFLSQKERFTKALGAIDISDIEGSHSALDTDCGIDFLAVDDDGQEFGIASRQVNAPCQAFLLKGSEYRKWKLALDTDGALRPHWIIQGEWQGNDLVAYAIVRVRSLIETIQTMRAHGLPVTTRRFKDDGKLYYSIPWALLETLEEVKVWRIS